MQPSSNILKNIDRLLTMFFMTLFMGLLLSCVFTYQSGIWQRGFIIEWLNRFVSTYVIVLPSVILVSPIANKCKSWVMPSIERKISQEQT